MNNREEKIKTIVGLLTRWELESKKLKELNLQDGNVLSEQTVANIFNIVFDYELVNANVEQNNFPCLDLVDRKNRIAFQVSASSSRAKITKTLKCFIDKEQFLEFDTLNIFVLGEKLKHRKLESGHPSFIFSDENVFDFYNLVPHFSRLPLGKLSRLIRVLQEQVGSSIDAPKPTLTNAALVKRRIATKKRLMKKLLVKNLSIEKRRSLAYWPDQKFNVGEILIRNVDDTSFPDKDLKKLGTVDDWFRLDIFNDYEYGLEFLFPGGPGSVVVGQGYKWAEVDSDDNMEFTNGTVVPAFYIARIPYDFIVEYEEDFNNIYGHPSLHVKFNSPDGTPYASIERVVLGCQEARRSNIYLEKEHKVDLSYFKS